MPEVKSIVHYGYVFKKTDQIQTVVMPGLERFKILLFQTNSYEMLLNNGRHMFRTMLNHAVELYYAKQHAFNIHSSFSNILRTIRQTKFNIFLIVVRDRQSVIVRYMIKTEKKFCVLSRST